MAKPKSLPYDAPDIAGSWSVGLRYVGGGSDKVYRLSIEPVGELFVANFANGRYGGTLATGTKTPTPVDYETARKAANKVLYDKVGNGYLPVSGSRLGDGMTEEAIETVARTSSGHVPQLLNVIDAEDLDDLIADDRWIAELKWDGERRIVAVSGGVASGGNRRGETVPLTAAIRSEILDLGMDVVLDGEQIGETFVFWDILSRRGEDLRARPLAERIALLDTMAIGSRSIQRSAVARTAQEKRWLTEEASRLRREGVVFKKLDAPYVPGRPNSGGDWRKLKFWYSLSAVVSARNDGRSVAIHLVDGDGERVAVGNVTIPANHPMPDAGDVVEVGYIYALPGGSLIQPVYRGPRTDIVPEECLADQIVHKERPMDDVTPGEPASPRPGI